MDNQIRHYEQAVDDLFHNRLQDTTLSELKTPQRKHLRLYHMTLGAADTHSLQSVAERGIGRVYEDGSPGRRVHVHYRQTLGASARDRHSYSLERSQTV